MAPAPPDDDVSAGSILRDLIFNQYQAIVLGGTALASLVALNPLPLIVWLGSEMVLLPVLDSGPLRRLVNRRKRAAARAKIDAARQQIIGSLAPQHAKRYRAVEHLCSLIEQNYQSLTGISQAYLSEQRGKLDQILLGTLNRLTALQRYERMPARRTVPDIEEEIVHLEHELADPELPERAAAAMKKNLELKQQLLASVAQIGDTVRTLYTEIDSMEALVEVLHQNSMSLRDPQAISDELDSIVKQSEESTRAVREMEALLRADTGGWEGDLLPDAPVSPVASRPSDGSAGTRQKVKGR